MSTIHKKTERIKNRKMTKVKTNIVPYKILCDLNVLKESKIV